MGRWREGGGKVEGRWREDGGRRWEMKGRKSKGEKQWQPHSIGGRWVTWGEALLNVVGSIHRVRDLLPAIR